MDGTVLSFIRHKTMAIIMVGQVQTVIMSVWEESNQHQGQTVHSCPYSKKRESVGIELIDYIVCNKFEQFLAILRPLGLSEPRDSEQCSLCTWCRIGNAEENLLA